MCDQLMSYYDNAKTIFVFFELTLPLTLKTKKNHAKSKKDALSTAPK